MMRILAIAMALLMTAPALAHRLTLYAWVDGETLVVEGKFANGGVPKLGMVQIFDGLDQLLLEAPIGENGELHIPLPEGDSGLRIEMRTSEGHEDYWILTPEDIKQQRSGGQ